MKRYVKCNESDTYEIAKNYVFNLRDDDFVDLWNDYVRNLYLDYDYGEIHYVSDLLRETEMHDNTPTYDYKHIRIDPRFFSPRDEYFVIAQGGMAISNDDPTMLVDDLDQLIDWVAKTGYYENN